jgi:hypothetical protein
MNVRLVRGLKSITKIKATDRIPLEILKPHREMPRIGLCENMFKNVSS